MAKIIVTGGAGYIGSHTCLALLERGDEVVVVDNLCNAPRESLTRVEAMAGKSIAFYECDLMHAQALDQVFAQHADADAVIHFAALKAVGESVQQPLRYYENNIIGSLNLCSSMCKHGVRAIVFSSSATVYGDPESVPVKEEAPLGATNPYGHTKQMMEQILWDAAGVPQDDGSNAFGLVNLRYFNPVGAHPSGKIGEDPAYPNNLVPFVSQVAAGIREKVMVFGDDWPTPDGTGVRDYIHVVDLADAHLAALDKIIGTTDRLVYNLGTGRGYSVIEVIEAFGEACGSPVPYEMGPRRAGDVAEVTADSSLANRELGWEAKLDLATMVEDHWRWQKDNPNGYR